MVAAVCCCHIRSSPLACQREIVSVHTVEKIVSVVIVQAADQPAAAAVALAVMSEALSSMEFEAPQTLMISLHRMQPHKLPAQAYAAAQFAVV